MSEAPETMPSVDINPADTRPEPTFGRMLQGVWLLTWKNQFSLRRLPTLLINLLTIPALVYFTVDDGRTEPYFHWAVDFYLLLLVPLYCLSTCGAMIRDEIQADTLRFLITRPVTRVKLYAAKYLCQMAWMQSLALCSGLFLLSAGFLRHIPGVGPLSWKFLGTQVLVIMAYGALSGLLGMINQRYMVLGIVYGFVVELGIGKIPTNVNNLSISRHLRTLLANDTTIADLYLWSNDRTAFSILMLLIGAMAFLSAAALLFTVREYHHNEEIQK